jgi:rfaE bifunctional protein kinase chain/domain
METFPMKKEQLQKILNDIRQVRIALIGDFCLDAYWFIDEAMSEISVETNLPTHPVARQRYSPGGAGNVAANLAALGVREIRAFGVTGTDPFGSEMVRILNDIGVITNNMLVQEVDWHTHTYAKPYLNDREINRLDFGNNNRLSRETADKLIDSLIREIPEVDVVIINQQVPSGIHTGYFRDELVKVIGRFPGKMFMADSRNFNDQFNGTIRKMNDAEAARLCGLNSNPGEKIPVAEIITCANELFRRYRKPMFITRGERGSLTIDQTGITEIPGLLVLSDVDTVGAGDSYLAGAASALAAGYDMNTSARIGSFTAGVTIRKLFQTGTATPEEIMASGLDPDYIYKPELAEDRRHARYLPGSEIEIVNDWPEKPRIEHVIFDHDGTLSTLREGWEQIMAPMMVKAILGDAYQDAGEGLFSRVKKRVDEFIDKTTGIQTLVQMQGLIGLIREFGCVPEQDLLDESGYKKIYNDELLILVRQREQKFLRGELSLDDLTLKNAVPFLQRLHDSGIRLYLTSGTDEADVRSEAQVLGYDHLFEGRIYGAVGDVNKEAKKIVLDRILDTLGEAAGRVATFGDGPVEIRETRKRGGITIGIASNELKRFGLNEHKRTRLIMAGADIIVPDFSQYEQLLRLLNI